MHALVSFDKTKKKREEKNEKPSDRLLRSPGTNTLMVLTFSMRKNVHVQEHMAQRIEKKLVL